MERFSFSAPQARGDSGGVGPSRFELESSAPQAPRIPSYPTDPWNSRRLSPPGVAPPSRSPYLTIRHSGMGASHFRSTPPERPSRTTRLGWPHGAPGLASAPRARGRGAGVALDRRGDVRPAGRVARRAPAAGLRVPPPRGRGRHRGGARALAWPGAPGRGVGALPEAAGDAGRPPRRGPEDGARLLVGPEGAGRFDAGPALMSRAARGARRRRARWSRWGPCG